METITFTSVKESPEELVTEKVQTPSTNGWKHYKYHQSSAAYPTSRESIRECDD